MAASAQLRTHFLKGSRNVLLHGSRLLQVPTMPLKRLGPSFPPPFSVFFFSLIGLQAFHTPWLHVKSIAPKEFLQHKSSSGLRTCCNLALKGCSWLQAHGLLLHAASQWLVSSSATRTLGVGRNKPATHPRVQQLRKGRQSKGRHPLPPQDSPATVVQRCCLRPGYTVVCWRAPRQTNQKHMVEGASVPCHHGSCKRRMSLRECATSARWQRFPHKSTPWQKVEMPPPSPHMPIAMPIPRPAVDHADLGWHHFGPAQLRWFICLQRTLPYPQPPFLVLCDHTFRT